MAGLPHHRPRTGRGQRGRQDLGALHVEDDRRARPEAPHRVAAEHDQQLVAVDDLAGLVHRADPVAVAVERDPQLRAVAPDLRLEVAQVLGDGGIGMVVGEGPVRLAEERHDLGAQRAKSGDGDQARGAVAAVHHDRTGRSSRCRLTIASR